MKNISLSKLIVVLVGISALSVSAWEFVVVNRLSVPIRIELPLFAGLESPKVMAVSVKGRETYKPEGWYSGYCLDMKNIKVAKEGANFVATPLKQAKTKEDLARIRHAVRLRELQRLDIPGNNRIDHNRLNVLSQLPVVDFGATVLGINPMYCNSIEIEIIEDMNGNIFAIAL